MIGYIWEIQAINTNTFILAQTLFCYMIVEVYSIYKKKIVETIIIWYLAENHWGAFWPPIKCTNDKSRSFIDSH